MEKENESLLSELSQEDVDAMGDDLFDGWDDDPKPEDADASEEKEENEGESVDDEDESEESDQTEEESEEETEKPDDSETDEKSDKDEDKTSPKSYTFTHLDDEPITLTPEEMVPYVNKGLDYDRIRAERDAMKGNYGKYEMYAEFLERIKGKFDSVEDLMDDTDASLLVKNEAVNGRTLTKEEALKAMNKFCDYL